MLVEGSDGALYGLTLTGGSDDAGVLFKLSKDGSNYCLLHSFDRFSNPHAVVAGRDSMLYGMTVNGGTNGVGSAFELNLNGGEYSILRSFAVADGFISPLSLLEGSDDKLYGTAFSGEGGYGAVFALAKDGSDFSVLRAFGSAPDEGWASARTET